MIVQPSCVQTASTAVKPFALVRATRNAPAIEFTSAAPPAAASGEFAVFTCTAEFAKTPVSAARSVGVLLGPDGDDDEEEPELQDEKTAESAAAVAAVHAPAQNDRRETFVFTQVSWGKFRTSGKS